MDTIKSETVPNKVKDLAGDTIKILAHAIVQSNELRMEKLKRDLLPEYRSLAYALTNRQLQSCLGKTKLYIYQNDHEEAVFIKAGRGEQQPPKSPTSALPGRNTFASSPTQQEPSDTYDKSLSKPSNSQTTQDD